MQERVVNGVLCRRLGTQGGWTPVSRPELTKMLVDLRAAYKLLAASAALVKEEDEISIICSNLSAPSSSPN